MKEFCLGDKVIMKTNVLSKVYSTGEYKEEDVEEFIRRVKEKLCGNNKSFVYQNMRDEIDKLAGEKLI